MRSSSARSFPRVGRWSCRPSRIRRRSGRRPSRSRRWPRSSATTRSGSTTTSTTSRCRRTKTMFECWTTLAAISQRTIADPARPDGRLRAVPQPRTAREDHGEHRRDLGRAARLGHRCGLVRARVRGIRLRVPRREGSHRGAARDRRDREVDVDRARHHLRRPLLHARGRAVRSQAGAAAAPADLDRRRRRAADAARRRAPRRPLELRRQAPRVGAQVRGA